MVIIPKIKKEKVAVYIDGSNFYNYLKDEEINFPKGVKFDFNAFVKFLVGDRECVSKRYYTGVFRNLDGSKKSAELVKKQQKFFSQIEKDGFIIKRGRIMKTDGDYKEKGTDVKIATDLITGAVDNWYDTAILVSSDTDLIPAIKYIKYKKKKLEYVGFSHNPSLGMQKHVNLSKLLSMEDIERFKKKTMPKINSIFIAYLKTLKPGDWNKKITDKWTVKDVVAHMIGWEKEDAHIIKSIWKNKETPWFYKTEDYDVFNQRAVDYYKDHAPDELIKEWEKWQEKVEEEIKRIGENKLRARPDLFRWLFEEGDDTHYVLHYRQIKDVIEKK